MIGSRTRKPENKSARGGCASGAKTRKHRGCTLLEIVVVLGLFSVMVIIIVNVFLLALRSQRQTSFRQQTLSNLRYVMETITRQVRTSEIDYQYYGGAVGAFENSLALKDQSDRQFVYSLSADGDITLLITQDEATEEALLTTVDEIKVLDLLFYISPATNPFSAEDRCSEDSDCEASSSGCSVNFKFCQGGDQAGQPCNQDSDCPGGTCGVGEAGFCLCNPANEQNDCATKHCDSQAEIC